MKKILLVFLLTVQLSSAEAQTMEDLFHVKTLVLFGVDFSLARILPDNESRPYTSDVNQDIQFYNNSFITSCFENKGVFKAGKPLIDTSYVKGQNSLIHSDDILSNRLHFISNENQITKRISEYKTNGNSGAVGMVIFVESIDEIRSKEYYYMVFFDIASKKVLAMDKIKISVSSQKKYQGHELWETGLNNILLPVPQVYKFWSKYPRTF